MNRCYSARPHLKDEFRTTVKGKAAPLPCDFADEDRDDRVVTKKETIKSWLKIPRSELMNKRRSKKEWRRMMQLDTIEGREKAGWLKEARDYSFLSSDSDITTTSCENIIIPQVRRCPVVSSGINKPRNNILRRPVKKSIVKEKAPVSKKPLLSSKNDSKKETLISKKEIILPAKKKNPLLCQESRKRKLVVMHEEEDEEISTVFSDKKESVIRVPTKFSDEKEPVIRIPTKLSDEKEPTIRVPNKFSDEKEEAKTEATNVADIEKEETRSAKIAKIAENDNRQEVITTTTKKSLRIRINIKTGVMIMV